MKFHSFQRFSFYGGWWGGMKRDVIWFKLVHLSFPLFFYLWILVLFPLSLSLHPSPPYPPAQYPFHHFHLISLHLTVTTIAQHCIAFYVVSKIDHVLDIPFRCIFFRFYYYDSPSFPPSLFILSPLLFILVCNENTTHLFFLFFFILYLVVIRSYFIHPYTKTQTRWIKINKKKENGNPDLVVTTILNIRIAGHWTNV